MMRPADGLAQCPSRPQGIFLSVLVLGFAFNLGCGDTRGPV